MVRQFRLDLLRRMVPGHHLYRANLDFHYLPLFRRDLLFLTDLLCRWHPVTLMDRQYLKVR